MTKQGRLSYQLTSKMAECTVNSALGRQAGQHVNQGVDEDQAITLGEIELASMTEP